MISEIKQIWNGYFKDIAPELRELKEAWANGIDEIHIIWADAKAEVQAEQHQEDIDTLAIQAQLAIDELKQNPYFK